MGIDQENNIADSVSGLKIWPGELFAGPLICGVDEAGRGPLAGPVVAAAVILADNFNLEGIKDSKCLTPARRQVQRIRIMESSCLWGIGVVGPEEIDRINILQASFLAMKKAIESLKISPEMIFVDGHLPIPGLKYKQQPIIGGDALKPCISAASILAKTYRDELMIKYAEEYPSYGFEKHKGYPTLEHVQALTQFGPCLIHRKSFYPVSKYFEKLDE
jgi:ribonuclease HII